MLEGLCGNKNIQRILIFLFVNGKCYGTQLHRLLKTPLTPLQKALNRLEKGEIIVSYLEGKTRLYQFNPAYPLMEELEQLLRKAYTLLPGFEKKQYYVVKDEYSSHLDRDSHMDVLLKFWGELMKVTKLAFTARTKSKEEWGWNGKGKGEVTVSKEGTSCLIFNERGSWQDKHGADVSFTNSFRWTLDRKAGLISLEHLRRGPDHPVFLFNLAPSGRQSLSSVDSHLCDGDTYFGQVSLDRFNLRLNWRVIGLKKNEELDYRYT